MESMSGSTNDDPRKLRSLLERATDLAKKHEVRSVVVGLVAPNGTLGFPEFIEFLRAALRVEDAIFRMTRERVVVHLADVDREGARAIIERLLNQFRSEVPTSHDVEFALSEFEIPPGTAEVSVRDALTTLFSPSDAPTMH